MFIKVVGIKFRNAGRIYYYNSEDMDLNVGELVIVNSPSGQKIGQVVVKPTMVPKDRSNTYNVLEQKNR
jgi:cell fate regulator YaaT (PSP1 superfamily)